MYTHSYPTYIYKRNFLMACLNMLFLGACTAISRQLFQRLRLQSRRVFGEIITRWHCFHRLHFVVKLMRAVKTYFVLDAEQSIAAAIFAEGLDAENCLPTEYSGYASAAAPAFTVVAAVAAVWKRTIVSRRKTSWNWGRMTWETRQANAGSFYGKFRIDLNEVA